MNAPPPSRERSLRVLVVALAAVLRGAGLVTASQLPLFRHMRLDNLVYHDAARQLVGGDWLLGRDVLHMSPGYTAFMAAIYATAGEGPWPWRLAQMLLGLATVWFVGDVAATVIRSWRWGVVASLVAALYGPFIFYEQQLLPEAVSTFLHAGLLASAVRLARGLDDGDVIPLRRFAGLGLWWGIAVLVRPNAMLLGAPLALGLAFTGLRIERARLRAVAAMVLAAACVVAPVTVRNTVVAGERVLVTDSGGLNFYLGNGPGAEGTFRVPDEIPDASSAQRQFPAFRAYAERETGRHLTSREVDAFWFAKTFAHIRRHPRWWARLLAEKTWLFWNAREIPNTEDYTFVRGLDPVLGAPLVQFWMLSPFALVGTALWLLRRRREEALVAGVNVTFMSALVGFFVLAHYRVPAVPGLLVAAVGLVAQGVAWWRAGDRKPTLAAALAVALTVPLVAAPKVPKPWDDEWYKLGYAYHRQGRLMAAEHAYREALRIAPDHLSAHKNLAILRETLGDTTAARREWQAVLRIATATHRANYITESTAHLRALEGR